MNPQLRSTLLQVVPICIALVILFIAIKKGKIKKEDISLYKPVNWRTYCMWVAGFVIYTIGIELLLYKLGLLKVHQWDNALYISIIKITGAVILAPVVEEIVFRGVLLSALNKKVKTYIAVILQAAAFVLLHSFAYQFTLSSNISIVQVFFDAVLFALARLTTRSLLTSVTMHAFGNAVAILERII